MTTYLFRCPSFCANADAADGVTLTLFVTGDFIRFYL